MNKVTEELKKVEEHVENLEAQIKEADPETDREAKQRQPWMPLAGSIICGLILFAILALFMGWF